MENISKTTITVENTVKVPVEKAWKLWTGPEHIMNWNNPSDDWHTPSSENDLRVGGKFVARMEAKDGSFGFDFWGIYDKVELYKLIEYTLGDDRKVINLFTGEGNATRIVVTFEAESTNPLEIQRGGWQAILDSYIKYAESQP